MTMTSFSDFNRRSFIGISATAAAGLTLQGRLARAATIPRKVR